SGNVVWKSQTVQVSAVQPVLQLIGVSGSISPTRTIGAPVQTVQADFCVTQIGCTSLMTLNSAQTVSFSLSPNTNDRTLSPTPATVQPNGFATASVTLSSPGVVGSYTLNASDTTDPTFAAPATAGPVTVRQPAIQFLNGGSPLTLGAGMHQAVSIQLDTPAP